MGFTLPTFNLRCNIYTGPWATKALRIPDQQCNLAWGKRGNVLFFVNTDLELGAASPGMIILLPARTDIRCWLWYGTDDLVECPSGSGRWYSVAAIDDIGKGFANEHRAAWLTQISQWLDPTRYPGLDWPIPAP